MLRNVDTLPEWLASLRESSGLNADVIPTGIWRRISDETDSLQYIDEASGGWPFKYYLDYQLREVGDWGIFVMRDAQPVNKTPNMLRKTKTSKYEFDFKTFGIAEWLASTLQNDQRSIKKLLLPGSTLPGKTADIVAYGSYNPENTNYKISLSKSEQLIADTTVIPTYGVA